ncbi:MAG: putative secreted protein [Frankiales bacterium]|nr:putative secreted protein [Frankiales bacterium]
MRGVLSLGAAVAVGLAGVAAASGDASLDGPDVSSHQHPNGASIDWQKAADSGASFAFVKATESTSYKNPYFAGDYAAAHDAGLVRSAYHYARPKADPATARDQADYFVQTAGHADAKGDLPLTLDIEESGGLAPKPLIAWTHAFVDEVTALTNRPVIIYTYPYFWQHAMADTSDFADLPLWIASYRSGGPKEPLPGGWSSWTFWQYTASGRLAGIPAAVDRSKFAGSAEELQALADPTPPAPTPSSSPLPIPLPTLTPLP